MVRLGSALFNADHTRLGDELRRAEDAGIDFVHLDVFDGYFVPDQGFPARTIAALRPLTRLPFEVHLAVRDPLRFIPALAAAGVDVIFLPAETTPLLYEAIFSVHEAGLRAGLCLALGTPLEAAITAIPLLDALLLLGRVTGEGSRGRTFNELVIQRARTVQAAIVSAATTLDMQIAGGLELETCQAAVAAGATSLPLGAALHRQVNPAAYLSTIRAAIAAATTEITGILQPAQPDQPTIRQGSPPMGSANSEIAPHAPSPAAARPPYHVLVASRSFGRNCPDVLDKMRAAGCVFLPVSYQGTPTEKELLAHIGEADVLISGTEPVTARVLAAASHLKVIAKHGVGYENIDLVAARERHIVVAIAGGAVESSVADMTMALLLALARDLPRGVQAVRAGTWPRIVGMELRGKTLGIVGLGAIGKAVCQRARAFDMHVVAFDVYEDATFATAQGVAYLSLDDVLRCADIVSLHAPVSPETRQMINAKRLALMKPTAYLINTARGELVDEDALVLALQSGKIAGAALDVFIHEPPGGDHPLLTLENVIATPHSAGQTQEGLRRMGEVTADNVLRVLRGEAPLYAVR